MLQRILTGYRNAFRGLPRNVWLLSLVLLVNRSGTMVLPYLSIYATTRLGFEPYIAGWALAAYGLGGIISGFLGGWLTERIGSIHTQMVSFALSVPGFLILGQLQSIAALSAGLLFLGIAMEMMRPAANTATVSFCNDDSQHARALGVNRLAVNLGMSIGPTIGGFLAVVNYQWLFWGNAIGGVLSFLTLFVLFGRRHEDATQTRAADNHSMEPENVDLKKAYSGNRNQSVWNDRNYLLFCLFNALSATVLFQFMGTYPLYLKDAYGFRENGIGLLFAVNTILIVLFELVLVSAVQRRSPLRVFAWGQFLCCLGFGLLPLAINQPQFIGYSWCVVSMLVITMGEMLAMPFGATHVARCSTPRTRGRYMGVYASSFSVAFLAAPLAGTAIYQFNRNFVWYCALVTGCVLLGGLLRLARKTNNTGKTVSGGA